MSFHSFGPFYRCRSLLQYPLDQPPQMRGHLANDLRPMGQMEVPDHRSCRREISSHHGERRGNLKKKKNIPSTAVDSGSHETILCKSLLRNSDSIGSARDISPLEAFFNSSSLRIHPTCSEALPVFEYTEIFLMFTIEQFSELEHRGLVVEPSGSGRRYLSRVAHVPDGVTQLESRKDLTRVCGPFHPEVPQNR